VKKAVLFQQLKYQDCTPCDKHQRTDAAGYSIVVKLIALT